MKRREPVKEVTKIKIRVIVDDKKVIKLVESDLSFGLLREFLQQEFFEDEDFEKSKKLIIYDHKNFLIPSISDDKNISHFFTKENNVIKIEMKNRVVTTEQHDDLIDWLNTHYDGKSFKEGIGKIFWEKYNKLSPLEQKLVYRRMKYLNLKINHIDIMGEEEDDDDDEDD